MHFDLSEDLLAIRKAARDFAKNEILPTVDMGDKAHHARKNLIKKMAELGFFGTVIPEQYGGNGMGYLAQTIITEEIARIDSSMRQPFNMQTNGPALTLLKWGTETQKIKYIPDLINLRKLGCFAITEPDTGSDVASMKTVAAKDVDGYVLNGQKTWITNAPVADLALVYAYTEPGKRLKGMSAFIVEMDLPGIEVKSIEDKRGAWAASTGKITFDNCRIPEDSLIGKEGEGFKICMEQLDNTRINCAAGALGVAQACLDVSLEYANQRKQFGQEIGRFQIIQDIIAQMAVEIEAARLLLYRACCRKDQGLSNTREISMAKFYCAETANKCADYAMNIFSAYSYSKECQITRYCQEAKFYQIVEGTSMMHKMIIAADLLGYRKRKNGSQLD